MFIAQYVLWVDIWLTLIEIDNVILRGWVDLGVILVSAIAIAKHGLCDHCPGIGVQKDPAVFLRAGWVGRYATVPWIVAIVARCREFDPVLCVEMLIHGIHGLTSALLRGKA